jgi:hypothetical protein
VDQIISNSLLNCLSYYGIIKWYVLINPIATYPQKQKVLKKVTIVLQISPQLEVCSKRYGPPKSQFWESRDKMTFGRMPHGHAQRILQGGKCWLPPSSGRGESYEFVYACGSFVHQKCSNHKLTNLLFGLCKYVWIIDPLITCPSPHPRAPTCPSNPKVLWTRECTPIPFPFDVFTFGLTIESIKEFGGMLERWQRRQRLCYHVFL